MSRTKITAHRGYCKNHPENTIAAFEEALRLGCDRIELDVHLSKDQKLIVHHDYSICTRGGRQVPIMESVYSEMLPTVPLLQDVLEICKGRVELEIELKGSSASFIDAVLAAVSDYRSDQIEFTSSHPYVLSYVRSKRADARLGLFVSLFPDWLPKSVGYRQIVESLELGCLDVAHCPLSILDKELVEELQRERYLVHAANCNSRSDLESAFELRVDQLSTDELELALALRAA